MSDFLVRLMISAFKIAINNGSSLATFPAHSSEGFQRGAFRSSSPKSKMHEVDLFPLSVRWKSETWKYSPSILQRRL